MKEPTTTNRNDNDDDSNNVKKTGYNEKTTENPGLRKQVLVLRCTITRKEASLRILNAREVKADPRGDRLIQQRFIHTGRQANVTGNKEFNRKKNKERERNARKYLVNYAVCRQMQVEQ